MNFWVITRSWHQSMRKEYGHGYVPIQANPLGSKDPGVFPWAGVWEEYLLPDVQNEPRVCHRRQISLAKVSETLLPSFPRLACQPEAPISTVLDDSLVLDDPDSRTTNGNHDKTLGTHHPAVVLGVSEATSSRI